MTGVGYDTDGEILVNDEPITAHSNPSISKLLEVSDSTGQPVQVLVNKW